MEVLRRDSFEPKRQLPSVGELERGPIEPWRVVGMAGQPGYRYPFAATPGEPLRFRKLPSGLVECSGVCDSVTGDRTGTTFNLPIGYRPNRTITVWGYCRITGVNAQDDFLRVSAFTDGNVYVAPVGPPAGGAVYISHDQLRFQLVVA
jgi:hypothetical protein